MRLAVFDTSVLISAGIRTDSPPAILVDEWILEGQVQLVTCPAIIEEYRTVFRRPRFKRYGFPPPWLDFVIAESLQLPDPPEWTLPIPDPADAVFLALAHHAGAWSITGNQKHFPASSRGGVVVISPADYLFRLQG